MRATDPKWYTIDTRRRTNAAMDREEEPYMGRRPLMERIGVDAGRRVPAEQAHPGRFRRPNSHLPGNNPSIPIFESIM